MTEVENQRPIRIFTFGNIFLFIFLLGFACIVVSAFALAMPLFTDMNLGDESRVAWTWKLITSVVVCVISGLLYGVISSMASYLFNDDD